MEEDRSVLQDKSRLPETPQEREDFLDRLTLSDLAWEVNQKQEERLRRSEGIYRAVFEKITVGIALVDLEGRILETNGRFREMLGYRSEELHLRNFEELMHPDDRKTALRFYGELLGGKRTSYEMEGRFTRKEGGLIWSHLSVSVVHSREGEPRFTIRMVEDITEHKRLESRFVQSQKMETVGRLAGGIAHDFNNFLTVIRGYGHVCLMALREGDPLRANIEEIIKATERAEDLTGRLLAFSRQQVTETKVIDMNQLVRGLEKILRRLIGEDIELRTALAADLGRIRTDPGQIETMILNLAANARDAMPKGGVLTLETSNVELDEPYSESHVSVVPGRYVKLTVSDTGCGMPPEVLEKIFDPFFTTKKKGKGTGLGLSMVYGIVKQSGGNIWAYSEPGYGTTFKIYFPRVDEEVRGSPVQSEMDHLPKGREVVLLVEDDERVRSVTAAVLATQGYKVFGAANGEEALLKAKEHEDEEIHLLLTDVVMPGMSGKALFEKLRENRPNLKALFTSGYTEQVVRQHGLSESFGPFLQKPFSPRILAARIREILDEP